MAARGRDVHARVKELRHELATTTEPGIRSRLRVRLTDLLCILGDVQAAAAELKQAAAEAPPCAGVLFGQRVVSRRLPAADIDALSFAIPTRRQVRPASARPAPKPGARAGRQAALPVGAVSPAVTPPLAPLPVPPRESPVRDEPLEQALAALAEGKPIRARRLGEEAARRAGYPGGSRRAQIGKLVAALEQTGSKRESLRLERTLAEIAGDASGTASAEATLALREVIHRATALGEAELASRWATDLECPLTSSTADRHPSPPRAAGTVSGRFREAQRTAVLAFLEGRGFDAAITRLTPLLGGHPGGTDALNLAGRLAAAARDRSAGPVATVATSLVAPPVFAPGVEMLRAAFETERAPRRRQALAGQWARTLNDQGDGEGALVVLARAIEELPPDASPELRHFRAELLRAGGRDADLCRAIEADAQVEKGAARRALFIEQARLLDRMGDVDAALDVRLRALAESPGDLSLLAPARQRLESVGLLDRSLDLAIAALSQVTERLSRASLLRDIATLAEATAGDRSRASGDWHDVLSLIPGDALAREAEERLLRQVGDSDRLGELLSSWAAQEVEPAARRKVMWRLAEFRRVERQTPFAALPLYREIVATGGGNYSGLSFADEDWQRRDDLLAVHTARALAAPSGKESARALADRADLLTAADRWEDADRDLERALDLDPTVDEAIGGQERLYQRRGDLPTLRQRLTARVEKVTGPAAAHLLFGIGRVNEGLGDLPAAVTAYQQATAADATFRPPVTSLRQLAVARGDFSQAMRQLENEMSLCTVTAERIGLSVELAVLLTTKADAAPRAVDILDAALVLEPSNPAVLDAMFGAALAAGTWEKAVLALEAMPATGQGTSDFSQRYHRLGVAAEKAGQVDRALGFYSRSYARNPAFRPTLERLSEICFERQQWENTWKATEHLLERHGADLDLDARADLSLRSALSDLHVAQRLVAAGRVTAMLAGPVSSAGLRDLAESWGSMRFEPTLLSGIDGDRRSRALSRLAEVLALTEKNPGHSARILARETLAALAVAERRWGDALAALDAFGDELGLDPHRRCLFLISAGDILLGRHGDVAGAVLRYQRARSLNPREPRLERPEIIQVMAGDAPPARGREDQATPEPVRRS